MPKVEVENLTKRYGSFKALRDVNLRVENREYVTILGPSGCGKTTLIKCIAGIIEPSEGQIYIDGKLVNESPPEYREIGYVFQEMSLFPHMNVWQNVGYGPLVKGWSYEKRRTLSSQVLEMVGLKDRAFAHPEELSGGEIQKTAVARALSSGSRLLLLDEPLGALDARVRANLRHDLRRLVSELELTAIHVTHDQEEAMSISDRIVVMKSGQIVEIGSPIDLYLRPRKIFTANFVGEANFLQGSIVESSSSETIVDVDGLTLRSIANSYAVGEQVVVAIRPEFVNIRRYSEEKSEWFGKIVNAMFIGDTFRYEVSISNGQLLLVKCPILDQNGKYRLGEKVSLDFPAECVLVYRRPEKGLVEELSLE